MKGSAPSKVSASVFPFVPSDLPTKELLSVLKNTKHETNSVVTLVQDYRIQCSVVPYTLEVLWVTWGRSNQEDLIEELGVQSR